MLCSPSGLGTHDRQPQETSHVQGHILEGLRQVSHASGQFLEGLRHTWSGFGSQGFTGNEVEGESRHGVNKVTVVIDGVAREGIVDTNGAVQVIQKGPEYFSIASEEPELSTVDQTVPLTAPPLPSFGRPASSREIGSPFDPKARSPFRPTTPPPPPPSFGEEERPKGRQWVAPRPIGSPPRTRSQSPITPRKRPTLARLTTTPGGTCIPTGTPPQTPPVSNM